MSTDKIDPSKIEDQVLEKKKAAGELKDGELDHVTGGGVSNTIKTLGQAVQTTASKP